MREHLNKIRDVIAGGWCQGALVRPGRSIKDARRDPQPGDCFCIMGAISLVLNTDHVLDRRQVEEQLAKQLPADFAPIGEPGVTTQLDRLITFNDDEGTDKDAVLALIDKALADA